jgi:hypothetical protein
MINFSLILSLKTISRIHGDDSCDNQLLAGIKPC